MRLIKTHKDAKLDLKPHKFYKKVFSGFVSKIQTLEITLRKYIGRIF